MQTLGVLLGFIAAELLQLDLDTAVVTALAAADIAASDYVEAIRAYRKAILEGKIGDPAVAFPVDITTAPANPVPPGIFERLDRMIARIRSSPNYTDAIGEQLGIIPSQSGEIVPEEMKPSLKAVVQPGNVVEVSFVRGKTDGVEIETIVDGSGGWASAGRFIKSPAVLEIPDGTGSPRAVQIRARYLDGNKAMGLNSDTVNVVTTP
jgi:hypothetical protein